jgi:hypothetical protein
VDPKEKNQISKILKVIQTNMSTHLSTETNAAERIIVMTTKEQNYVCRPNTDVVNQSPTSVLNQGRTMSIHESWRERSCEWMYKVRK